MSSKVAFNQEIFRSQEAAFIEHYDWLRRWALQLTNHDRERAEDLIQEVFAQFATAHTDLSAVQNIPAYLYTTLRNIHVSEVRLAGRSHGRAQSIVEYSIAEVALGATDPYTLFHTQDQLRRVCQYACLRKQSSRAGSALILRYFHSYHLSEIAEVLGGSCEAVRQNLTFARNEARLFLEDPGALKFIEKCQGASILPANNVCAADQLLTQLRSAIFESCQGECLSNEFVRALYVERLIVSADNSTLAHIVSCPACLDRINVKLGLPLLAERHPADTLGPNNEWRDGPGGPRESGGSGNAVPSRRRARSQEAKINSFLLMQCRRRATELFEHHPRELCVSVNGHVLGSQAVNSEVSRLRLGVALAEELHFVEVLSEERARLLVLPIQPPPDGEPVQRRRIVLSEGRQLEVSFHYGHPWPLVQVVYEEPNFSNELQLLPSATERRVVEFPAAEPKKNFQPESSPQSARTGLFGVFRSLDLLRRPFWSNPGLVTAIVSLVLVSTLLTFRLNVAPPITAGNLLERATAAESAAPPAGLVTHRVIDLEQRRAVGGEIVGRSRIEIWRDEERDLTVRRVYDEKGELIARVWSEEKPEANARSLRRIYPRGGAQRIETGAQDPRKAIRDAELWHLEPSARVYSALVNRAHASRVSEVRDAYVISYERAQAGDDGLLQATLTLRKSDLHPISQTLIISNGRETFDFRFTEVSFEKPSRRFVNPAIFEPDTELLSKVAANASASRKPEPAVSSAPTLPSAVASMDLEINVAYALDRFRTRFGDQLVLTKTPSGQLQVKGVVDTEETRKEILKELSGVIDNTAAVRVEISTTAEVLAGEQRRSERLIVREFSGSDQSIPLYSELSRYFSTHKASGQTNEKVDHLVREFAARVVSRSRRALTHSLELKQLSSRFSPAEFERLTPSARTKFWAMVRNHAEALRRELSTLDGELRQILYANESPVAAAEAVEISSQASLLLAVDRLHQLVLNMDQVVRSLFAASAAEASTGEAVQGLRFRTGLITSLKLTDGIRLAAAKE